MSNQNSDDWSDLAATAIIVFLIGLAIALLRLFFTWLISLWQKHGHHPALRLALGAWIFSLVLTFALAFFPEFAQAALWMGIVGTAGFFIAACIIEAILDHRAAEEQDLAIDNVLHQWWQEES